MGKKQLVTEFFKFVVHISGKCRSVAGVSANLQKLQKRCSRRYRVLFAGVFALYGYGCVCHGLQITSHNQLRLILVPNLAKIL